MTDKGAHWFRCDLQVHTPRDRNWQGVDRIANEEREAYADLLVAACRARGLQGIGITDHHDMAFVEYVRRAAQEEVDDEGIRLPSGRRLIVFPGMELTLGVPCQALLIFDAEFPTDLFSLAMTALAITPNAATESKTIETTRLNTIQSLRHLKEKLDEHTYLRDRYIIFPNVGENGQFSLLRKGLAGKYIEMPCVGGYVDGDLNRLGTGNHDILAGRAREWGHKRLACFQTSDNRREDHRDLGRVSTWIKWATPTAEALRQACLAVESRVSQAAPRLPTMAVSSVSVSNSAFLGPVDLQFNSQYNALIGGRGTGKSTILEYLRWTLCDQSPGISDEDTPNYQARRHRLIEETLKPLNATVQVGYEVNGVPHAVRRSSQDGSLLIKIGDDEMRTCSEDEVRALLPIQAYSQKQLSDVSVRLEELSRFITAPIRMELARIERQLSDGAAKVRQSYGARSRQRSLTQTLQRRELEERSLSEQADALRAGLTGLSDADRELLDRGRVFDAADRAQQSWRDGAMSFQDGAIALQRIVDSLIAAIAAPPGDPDPVTLTAAHDEYRALLVDARTTLAALLARAEVITVPSEMLAPDSPWKHWQGSLDAFRTAYNAAVQRSSAHSETMKQLQVIEQQLTEHRRETARVREEVRGLETAEATYRNARQIWETLLRERDDLLSAECETLTTAAGGAIRAQVKRYADAAEFINVLRQSLSGSRIQGSKFDGLAEAIKSAADGHAQWLALLDDLERLAEFDPERDNAGRRPETAALTGFTAGDLDRTAHTLTPENWLTLSLSPIQGVPIFEYRARENEYIPFRNASAGQQATALLKTLLNQAGPPLIIDQPEEDLDNPVILEIVEQVWQAKQKRQIIFSSHNANLVVNGDAELVAWCDYRTAGDQSRGTIVGEGAIDVPNVRDAIKQIMEGGEAAFNLRREKYGF